MDDFDLGIATEGSDLGAIGADFCTDTRRLGIVVAAEHEPEFSIKAGIEWLMPTAIALYIANKYLGTLLQEAAKDHYPHLKAAVLRLVRRTTGRDRELTLKVLSSSPAKVSGADPATFTVWVALNGSRRAVFRFDHQIQPEDLALATDSLFRLLEAHAGGGETDFLSKAPTFSESSWAPVICRFDAELGRWQAWTIDRQGNTTPVSDNAT